MSNLFDISQAPQIEPAEIIAGNYTIWQRPDLVPDYSPADYALTYELRSEGEPARRIGIACEDSTTNYMVQLSSAITATFQPAQYHWSAYITRIDDDERVRVESGQIKVTPNRATDSADTRSFAKKILDSIEQAIEHRADNNQLDVLAYSLGVETSATRDPSQLLVWRTKFRAEVIRENNLANGKKGRRPGSKIGVRF